MYFKRSIDANQIKDEKDWLRVVATAEDIKTIQAEPKPYLKIRKIKELATRSLDVLKQLKESGRTAKDSTWFTDQEINLNRHIADLQKRLESESDQIQCVVSNNLIPNSIPFGQTQQPKLWDYADNVDTLQFLISL